MAVALTGGVLNAQEIRTAVPLAKGWRFHQGDVTELPTQVPSADNWLPVTVPHSWNRVGYYLTDPQEHINRADNVNKYQGVGWYRLEFTPPAGFAGKRAWLQFDAASRTAEIWLNGQRLGDHSGGFSRFRLDATATLKPAQPNILLVKIDNSIPQVGASTADILPLRGDFFIHGGLYRPVTLIATDPVHIDMMDSGGPGVYATTRAIRHDQAEVQVRARFLNDSSQSVRVTGRFRLLDDAGRTVAEYKTPLSLPRASGSETVATLRIDKPHLWQGTADPYLHSLVVELISHSGRVFDRTEQAFGIRQIRIDPQRGLFLNDQPLKLHGVGYHQDREGKGWAVSPQDVEADVAILREMGANTIRLTHYQHGEVIHNLADKYGLLLWDEIPLVTVWTLGGAKDTRPGLKDNARQQLRELIRQNYNHASVMTWSIANEVDFGNSIPAFLGGKDNNVAPDPMPFLRELNALAKAEDPSRPTTLATCCELKAYGPGVDVPTTAEVTDLSGANRYFGWYLGKPRDLGSHLDALHARRPQQPLSVTEYGAGGAITIHSDNVLGGPVDSRGRNQPEEYESYIHEQNWATLADKPYLWATWAWNSFDFSSPVRGEGDARDINTKGLVTYDRKIRKDAYYFYKANWTQKPTVHITGGRYVDRAYAVTPIRVYSNAPHTELLINGRSLGTLDDCPQKICVWTGVQLSQGSNQIVARGLWIDNATEDQVEWQLRAEAANAVRIDSGALVAGKAAGRRFGSDDFFEGGTGNTVYAPMDGRKPFDRVALSANPDHEILATYREGDFRYRVPLDNGRYVVTLTFIEPWATPGARQFDVLVNGRKVISGLDIAAAASAPLATVTRHIRVEVKNGQLDLRFAPIVGEAIVSAVEITR
ncbi:glycoside hydrolase family 2 TIM barrel-domain containing protein [Sphingobium sp.]|uniref:glycoside hydrolase family 2 TIM barrel-domain containing protein n=1 Tax=Sphingobium sp. TaxID=1912891 RepID=UPI0039C9DB99